MRGWKHTEKEISFIKENYPKLGPVQCAIKLKKSTLQLYSIAHKLGVRVSKEKLSNLFSNFDAKDLINVSTPECAYILGLLWADGFVDEKTNRVLLALVLKDFKEIEPLFIESGNWKIRQRQPPGHRQKLGLAVVNNLELNSFLRQNNYLTKSGDSACKILSKIPTGLQHYWWRGLFDGDGWFNFNSGLKYCFGISSCYQQDWTYAEDLFKKLDIKYYISKRKTKTGNSCDICVGNYDGTVKFGDYIYQGKRFGLSRKYLKFQALKAAKLNC